MCGFAGFADTRLTYDPARVLCAMTDALAHRGPDGEGYFQEGGMGLGFRRLAIIDPDGGAQPLHSESGDLVLVCNGEIYNHRELRAELELRGHVFATRSDAEVVLHGYEAWGEQVTSHLRGMFAFVLCNRRTRAFFGARDPFGIKPLYLYQRAGTFLFASESKAFFRHPHFRRALDERWLPAYLCFEYVPCARTLLSDVCKLEPGSSFRFCGGKLETARYFTPAYEIRRGVPLEAWTDALETALRGSVRAHCVSDVPVGCFLSGGVDSACVAGLLRADAPVRAFSVGYAERSCSELPAALETARALGVPCETAEISAEDFFGAAERVQYHMDEPLPNPSAVPLYFLSRLAARHVKVVLSGEGADELFGGYACYRECRLFAQYEKLPQAVRSAAARAAGLLPPFHGQRFLLRGSQPLERRYFRQSYVFSAHGAAELLRAPGRSPLPESFTAETFARVRGEDLLTRTQYADLCTWLPYDILLKADRMSMAASLELRVPFLDREVLALALQLPPEYRLTRRESKPLLRRAARRIVPERAARAPKIGFVTPLNDWLRQDRYYERVRAVFESQAAAQFFHSERLLAQLDARRAGKNGGMRRIWSVYSFLLWYDAYFARLWKGGAV